MNSLKYFRNKKGFTQKELAEKTGISYKCIEKYESGDLSPTVKKLEVIAKSLEIEVSYFFERENYISSEGYFLKGYNALTERDKEIVCALIDQMNFI